MTAPSSTLSQLAKMVHLLRTAPDDIDRQQSEFQALREGLAGNQTTVGADHATVWVDGHTVPVGTPYATELRDQMIAHHVGEIGIPANVAPIELLMLLRTLARPPGECRRVEDFVRLLGEGGARVFDVRGPRALPRADQLITLDENPTAPPAESAAGDSTPFNVPSLSDTYRGAPEAQPVWRSEEDTTPDVLRETQVSLDRAVRDRDWEKLLDIMIDFIDAEAKVDNRVQKRRYERVIEGSLPRRTLQELARLSGSGHRINVAKVLDRAGAEATAAVLDLLAEAETMQERREYFTLLSHIREGGAVIISRLSDKNWYVVRNVAELCGELGLEDAVPKLAAQLDHPEVRVRKAVATALGKIGTPPTAEPLRMSLRDPDPSVRLAAAQSLDGPKAKGLVMSLGVLIEEEEHLDVERELYLALGRIGTGEALKTLILAAQPSGHLFRRKPVANRLLALGGLALVPGEAARAALEGLTDDRSKAIRAAAREALDQRA